MMPAIDIAALLSELTVGSVIACYVIESSPVELECNHNLSAGTSINALTINRIRGQPHYYGFSIETGKYY